MAQRIRTPRVEWTFDSPARTIVDPSEKEIAREAADPRACVEWRGRQYCGPTVALRMRARPCAWMSTQAIIAPLPRDVPTKVLLGRDIIENTMMLDPRTNHLKCRR